MYREAGRGGHAKSTDLGKNAAIRHFAAFLVTKGMIYDECSKEQICNESIFRQFGTYLIENAL